MMIEIKGKGTRAAELASYLSQGTIDITEEGEVTFDGEILDAEEIEVSDIKNHSAYLKVTDNDGDVHYYVIDDDIF